MLLRRNCLLAGTALLALSVLWTATAAAADPAAAKEGVAAASQSSTPAESAESVDQLIAQLDSAEFTQREDACGKLAAKGKSAIPALEKAAATGNLEVSSRAATVLGKLLKSSDEATSKVAAEALQRLAEGDSPAAARKAKSILDEKNGTNHPGINAPVMPGFGQIIINGGQLNIGGGGAMRTMSVKNTNGVKEIEASEDGKTVKIKEDPAKGIKIEVTEKVNGKEVTKKYDGKNADDLKKNQPAGYELYKKYGGGQPGGAVQVQAGVIQLQGGAIPAMPLLPAIPVIPGQPALGVHPAPVGGNNRQVEVATIRVRNLSAELQRLEKADGCKNASPESKAELKKQIDELSKQLSTIRGQLGDK